MTKVFEDRLDAPAEADFFKLPVPGEGEIYSMAVHPAYLKDFLDHPFTVNRETQDYKDLFESIKNYGIRAAPAAAADLKLFPAIAAMTSAHS